MPPFEGADGQHRRVPGDLPSQLSQRTLAKGAGTARSEGLQGDVEEDQADADHHIQPEPGGVPEESGIKKVAHSVGLRDQDGGRGHVRDNGGVQPQLVPPCKPQQAPDGAPDGVPPGGPDEDVLFVLFCHTCRSVSDTLAPPRQRSERLHSWQRTESRIYPRIALAGL